MKNLFAAAILLAGSTLLGSDSPLWAQQAQPQPKTTPSHHRSKPAKRRKALLQTPPPAPAESSPQPMPELPATLMNSSPVKPSVTMQGGLLTIDAPNSVLSDVLSGVHKATGAAIEGASPNERVAVKLGPGKPEQVIAALLRGTPYDYVILGSPAQPDAITRILLSRSEPTRPEQMNARAPQPEQPQEEQPPRDVSPPEPEAPPQAEQQQPPPQQQGQQDQNAPKTPDQLFRELQQMQQQGQPRQP